MSDVTIHPAGSDDVQYIAERLRFSDARELETASGTDAITAVKNSVAASQIACTMSILGTPAIVFGVSHRGVIWMVCTDHIQEAPWEVLTMFRRLIHDALQLHPVVFNAVDMRNDTHIRWLKLLGAKLDDVVQVNGMPFQRFHFERKEAPRV